MPRPAAAITAPALPPSIGKSVAWLPPAERRLTSGTSSSFPATEALPKHRALERSIARIKALDKDASIREQYDGIADFERELFGIVQKAREEKGLGDEARYFVAFLWDVSYVDDDTVLVQPWYYVHRDTHGQFRVNFTPFTIPRELVSRLYRG